MSPNNKSVHSPTWFKDAIIYELHVRAFFDSVTDGVGDFPGLTQKLDYLQDLGITTVWLLPFCPSPLKDDGYDISNYTDVHPAYGTLREFQRFLREAHRRGLRVITELVLNHTSDQHPWFQRSRRAEPGSRWRNFYVWSDNPQKYSDARIIFKDFEASNWTWDPVAKAYFWHRFYSHQPDLNWESPHVREAMFGALDFWFDLGVDGLRLDAVPYLLEREGTNCENLAETHDVLKQLRKHVDQKYQDRMLLAEANQWPEDAVAYFGNGDECHMAFHFPVMPRLFMSLRMEDRYPITDILKLTPEIPENCQWALFLRNHDELTLEMVTDEERDYMYRSYAHDRQMRINLGIRRRLAPLLENDRRKVELMNGLLFSLPGTPVIYYGDEIGMGDNVYLGDRNGVRTPMQWSPDRNAGFSRANPQRLYLPVNIDPEYHYEAINVETQRNNSHSLLWWMKRLISQRKQFTAFGRGNLRFLYPRNRRIVAFTREYGDEKILVVANLSRFTQHTLLELGEFDGQVPVELFGRSRFPVIRKDPYALSLGPYAFYWFQLRPVRSSEESLTSGAPAQELAEIEVDSFEEVFTAPTRFALSRLLLDFLPQRRWFLGGRRDVRSVEVTNAIQLGGSNCYMLLIRAEYGEGDPETYTLPLAVLTGPEAQSALQERRNLVLAKLRRGEEAGVLFAAVYQREFADAVLRAITRRLRFREGEAGIVGSHTRAFRKAWQQVRSDLSPQVRPADQNNTIIAYGEDFILKVFRKVDEGVNPEREVMEFLTEQAQWPNAPEALGAIEFRENGSELMTLGLLTRFRRNALNAWSYTLNQLGIFFERAFALQPEDRRVADALSTRPLTAKPEVLPGLMQELLGGYTQFVRLLGQRTAEMHHALASRPDIPDFAPELFTDFYRMGVVHGVIGTGSRVLELARNNVHALPEPTRRDVAVLIGMEDAIKQRFQLLRDRRISALRIRLHGDYHLGQVLYTGDDFVVIDFEGDPRRAMSERRIKRSPVRDVAAMIRSFHYISLAALFGRVPGVFPTSEPAERIEIWAHAWYSWVSGLFLQGYLEHADLKRFVPGGRDDFNLLLKVYLLEKALIELEHEILVRPDWVRIPARGIVQVLQE
jgi:maltose alpha-D-glucosyltransferase / alpha-amylase